MRARLVVVACCVAAPLVAGRAAAQEDADDGRKALAEALFQDGRALLTNGKLAEACAKFAESEHLEPKLGTLLNLAVCHEQEGRTASAWAEYTEARAIAERTRQDERARFAGERAAALAAHLTRVAIAIAAQDPAPTLTLDGAPLGQGTVGTALPVDPGQHDVAAVAPGKARWQTSFRAGDGQPLVRIEVPALAAEPSRARGAADVPVTTGQVDENDQGAARARRMAGWSAVVVGTGALGASAFFGLRAFTKKSDGDALCRGDACSPAGLDTLSEAKVAATVSTIAFGVGLVADVIGAYLLITTPQRRGRAAWIAPLVDRGAGGIAAGGAF